MSLNDKIFKGTTWVLFLFLFTYLLLRVFVTDTLHDELATYFFYIYHGDFYGETIEWDANNHLLNSLLGRWLYLAFGDYFPIFRLPNALAFVLYFFGIRKLVKEIKTPFFNSLALIALTCIPFVFEYFGYCRGYGLSMAFLIWVFIFVKKYSSSYHWKDLLFVYVFLILAISANLTLINTALLTGTYLGIITIFKKPFKLRNYLKHIFISIVFLVGLLPFIRFSLQLKIGGALYYGGLDGIWDVTGKSLVQYVLFNDSDLFMYFFLTLFVGIGFYLIQFIRKSSFSSSINQPVLFYAFLFFGNLFGSLVLAWLLDVNYPMNRTGVYFIPMLLFLVIEILENSEKIKFLRWALLFFPFSLVTHISLDTSVFSPDDRMMQKFYKEVKQELKPEHSLMIYPTMCWNWWHKESYEKEKASYSNYLNANTVYADILLTKTIFLKNREVYKYYDLFAEEPNAYFLAFKRKVPLIKNLFFETPDTNFRNADEFTVIYTTDSLQPIKMGAVQVTLSGKLKTFIKENKIQLVVKTSNDAGEQIKYQNYPFEFIYQGRIIDDSFLHHFIFDEMRDDETNLDIYIWNRKRDELQMNNVKCYLYEVKNP